MADGRVFTGFVVSEGAATVQIRESSGALQELKRSEIEERRRQEHVGHAGGDRREPDARGAGRPRRLPPLPGSHESAPIDERGAP